MSVNNPRRPNRGSPRPRSLTDLAGDTANCDDDDPPDDYKYKMCKKIAQLTKVTLTIIYQKKLDSFAQSAKVSVG